MLDFIFILLGFNLAPIRYYLVLNIYIRSRLSTKKVDDPKVINHGGNYAVSNAASPLGRYITLIYPLVRSLKEERIDTLRYIYNGYVIKTIVISMVDSAL